MKKGFTLAEVLITLGIIGIIAAMTLPALVQKQQEKVRVTQLKKTYTILSQAFERIISESGFEPRDWGMGDMYDEESHKIFANKFLPYLNVIQNCVDMSEENVQKHCTKVFSKKDMYASIVLIDGTVLTFRTWSNDCSFKFGESKHLQNICGTFTVNINGKKPPELLGQDIFEFYLTNYGVFPLGTELDERISFNRYCDKKKGWQVADDNYYNGSGCTAWVIYNENMEYLHCSDLDWNGKKKCK